MEDPDRGWKPNGRPQSTVAQNFMSELDDLFKIDGGLDLLDKNVHQKKQAVDTHTQQLEALEARLKETEERLKQARSSPPTRKNSQHRTPTHDAFPPDHAKARIGDPQSPLAARRKQGHVVQDNAPPGALPETPSSDRSTDSYILVDRPRTSQSNASKA